MRHAFQMVAATILAISLSRGTQAVDEPLHFSFNEGVTAYHARDYRTALTHFTQCADRGNDPRYLYFRGLSYLGLGQKLEAERDFSRAAKIECDRIDLGDLLTDETKRLSSVSRSLERIRGAPRLAIENHRRNVYAFAQKAQRHKEKRIGEIQQRMRADRIQTGAGHSSPLQGIVGETMDIFGERVRILGVEEFRGGIQSITVIDSSVPMDPRRFAGLSINTGDRFVSGQAALDYIVQRDSKTYVATELGRLEHAKLPSVMVFNPQFNTLSDPASAAAAWDRQRAIQAEKLAQEKAAQEKREAERQRAERQRRTVENVATARTVPRRSAEEAESQRLQEATRQAEAARRQQQALEERQQAAILAASQSGKDGIPRKSKIQLYSNGRIDQPEGKSTWNLKGESLTLRWSSPKAPGGAWIDNCKLAQDGKSYMGRNQRGAEIAGRLLHGSIGDQATVGQGGMAGQSLAEKTAQLPTPWEEYLRCAPKLSMDINHYSAQLMGRGLGSDNAPSSLLTPRDPRLKKAFTDIAAAQRLDEKGEDRAAGRDMTPAERRVYEKGLEQLIEKGFQGAITGNADLQVDGLVGAAMAFGSLAAQGHAGSEMIEAARDAQCKAWQSIIEIPKANAGTTVVKSPLKFEVVIGPMRDRSVRVTNVSGKDLKSITIHVWTGLSDSDKEYYVFVPAWKAKESRQLSRALVMKLMDRMVPAMPVKDAFKYSVWCPELSIENVRLNLPPQHPKVDGKAEFFTKYFLCEPAVNRK